jgi:hypothetical protein
LKRTVGIPIVLALITTFSLGAAQASLAQERVAGTTTVRRALFEGRWINLAHGWGAARECIIAPGRPTECFRTRAAALAQEQKTRLPGVSCSTPLKLHDGTNQTGSTVSISVRGIWINLADLGFDNMTSSYTVGACAIDLASLADGGGFRYPRCLSADCVENVMANGWNNVVSSAYVH